MQQKIAAGIHPGLFREECNCKLCFRNVSSQCCRGRGRKAVGIIVCEVVYCKKINFCLEGASWVSWGLIKGAEYTGKAIHKGASKLREHIQPEEKPLEVNPTVAKGLHVAKQATGGAVKVSQFLGKNLHLIVYYIFVLINTL